MNIKIKYNVIHTSDVMKLHELSMKMEIQRENKEEKNKHLIDENIFVILLIIIKFSPSQLPPPLRLTVPPHLQLFQQACDKKILLVYVYLLAKVKLHYETKNGTNVIFGEIVGLFNLKSFIIRPYFAY